MAEKKIVDMTSTAKGDAPKKEAEQFKPSEENKKKATSNRIVAFVLWLVAIGLEIFEITRLYAPPVNIWLIVGILVVMAVLSIVGSLLWKKANRLDPASKKDKVRFFVQNQLGLIMAIIAFLPLIVLVFLNKDLDSKQKGIIGGVAVLAVLIAGFFGIDFNPPSVEKYTEEAAHVQQLMGSEIVYWTKHGKKYHLFSDCQHINREATEEIFQGKVADAYEHKHIEELCKTCENRALKLQGQKASDEAEDTQETVSAEDILDNADDAA